MGNAHFGMIGLGTMGRNFLLNIAEQGIKCVGYDLDAGKRELLVKEGAAMPVDSGADLSEFLAKLESPRNIMLLVPAGQVVDKVISDLSPRLDEDDLIIDGGNSHFSDTDRRESELNTKGLGFMGMGVSGGEDGARHGASIMPGGRREHYARIERVLQAVSAKVNGEPCVAYMGSGSAGHFVKMVHNGIEYGMMQLIAESYDYMQHGLGMSARESSETFSGWNERALNSFLLEITAVALAKQDPDSGRPLVEMILDTAGQKGTGKWTSQAAMDLGVPVPTIDAAVTMRQISAQKRLRGELSMLKPLTAGGTSAELETLEKALELGFALTYAQGLAMLREASSEKQYGLDLSSIAAIWRGGCIIRSAMLEPIRSAYAADPHLENLLLSGYFADLVRSASGDLRDAVASFTRASIPAACFSSANNYLAAMTAERLPANLIQAQRDLFGAHTYQRIDREGTFHTQDWGGGY